MAEDIKEYEVPVTMLGARRVGKTTFLAATWRAFNKGLFEETSLRLKPDSETIAQLETRLEELIRVAETMQVAGEFGIGATPVVGEQIYTFRLSPSDEYIVRRKPVIKLTFRDYSGELLIKRLDDVKKWLKESLATVIAIDSVALMESARENWDFLHELHNKPDYVAEILDDALGKTETPHLILFVPIRCEEYLRRDGGDELVDKIKSGYKQAFDVLRGNNNLYAIITPIQTIGTLYFDDIVADSSPDKEPTNSDYAFSFKKIRRGDTYKPQDTDQPFRYLLDFFMKLVILTRAAEREEIATEILGKFFGGILMEFAEDFFDKNFKESLSQFAAKRKTQHPFVIVQDNNGFLKPGG